MIRKLIIPILLLTFLVSCTEPKGFELGTEKTQVETNYRKPDSIKIENGIPDVYTNKLINIEVWYFGKDTSFIFMDNKLQTIKINK